MTKTLLADRGRLRPGGSRGNFAHQGARTSSSATVWSSASTAPATRSTAARRQCARADAAHRQRRGGDGDGQPARLRHPRHRMDITVSALGDSQSRRDAAGDAAARRQWQCLRGRSGFGRHRRLPGRGRGSASISDPGPRGRKMRLSRPVRPYELPFSAAATNFSATPFMQ